MPFFGLFLKPPEPLAETDFVFDSGHEAGTALADALIGQVDKEVPSLEARYLEVSRQRLNELLGECGGDAERFRAAAPAQIESVLQEAREVSLMVVDRVWIACGSWMRVADRMGISKEELVPLLEERIENHLERMRQATNAMIGEIATGGK